MTFKVKDKGNSEWTTGDGREVIVVLIRVVPWKGRRKSLTEVAFNWDKVVVVG